MLKKIVIGIEAKTQSHFAPLISEKHPGMFDYFIVLILIWSFRKIYGHLDHLKICHRPLPLNVLLRWTNVTSSLLFSFLHFCYNCLGTNISDNDTLSLALKLHCISDSFSAIENTAVQNYSFHDFSINGEKSYASDLSLFHNSYTSKLFIVPNINATSGSKNTTIIKYKLLYRTYKLHYQKQPIIELILSFSANLFCSIKRILGILQRISER